VTFGENYFSFWTACREFLLRILMKNEKITIRHSTK
jgi:hypothetical protein